MAHLVGRHVVIPSSEWPTDDSFENTAQGPGWPGAVIKYTPAPGGQRQRRGTGRTWDVIADVDSALGGQDKCAATVVINLTKLRKWIVLNDNEQREDIHDTQRARPAAAAAAAPRPGRRSLDGEARAAALPRRPRRLERAVRLALELPPPRARRLASGHRSPRRSWRLCSSERMCTSRARARPLRSSTSRRRRRRRGRRRRDRTAR